MTDRLIRITTALAVATVVAVAAIISYRHAYELVSTHGESGLTARLVPFAVDGLILAASMLILDASRRNQPVPPLARWCLGARAVRSAGPGRCHGPSCVSLSARSAGRAEPGADGTSLVRRGPQSAGDRPRAQPRPPQSQAHHRPSRVTASAVSGGDGPAGRMMAVIAVGAIYRYRVRGFTVGSCSSEELSSRRSTSIQRTSGASWRRVTQMSLSV